MKIFDISKIYYSALPDGTKLLFKSNNELIETLIISNYKYYDMLNLNTYKISGYGFYDTEKMIEEFCKDNNCTLVKIIEYGKLENE